MASIERLYDLFQPEHYNLYIEVSRACLLYTSDAADE